MLGVALRMSCCLLGVTWKFSPRNFKNNEIDCTIAQKKNHSEL